MTIVGLIGVPTSAGAFAPGQEQAPAALRAAGLVTLLEQAGLGVTDHGDRAVWRWRPDRSSPGARRERAEQGAGGDDRQHDRGDRGHPALPDSGERSCHDDQPQDRKHDEQRDARLSNRRAGGGADHRQHHACAGDQCGRRCPGP